jgi:hypothetical protein
MYWVMGKPVVLLGGVEHAENLLQKRMVNYGDRPELVVAQELVTQNGWYIGTARTKHDTHRKQRKILGERLRASALKEWAHAVELPEMHLFLQRLTQNPERWVSIIKLLTVNVMLNTTFAHGSMHNLDNPLVYSGQRNNGSSIYRPDPGPIFSRLSPAPKVSPWVAAWHGLEKTGSSVEGGG